MNSGRIGDWFHQRFGSKEPGAGLEKQPAKNVVLRNPLLTDGQVKNPAGKF
jgi:hypothetical protein